MKQVLQVARFLLGLFLAFQAISIFPALTWLGNLSALTEGLVFVLIAKVLLAAITAVAFVWVGGILKRKTKMKIQVSPLQ